jgi:hypothetical protein
VGEVQSVNQCFAKATEVEEDRQRFAQNSRRRMEAKSDGRHTGDGRTREVYERYRMAPSFMFRMHRGVFRADGRRADKCR